jgi:hypothetical protein
MTGPLKESERLRRTGKIVLAAGVVAACLFYWIVARPAARPMDDMLPGYERSQNRQMRMLMGRTGVMMMEWQDALNRPDTQAVLIGVVTGLFSLYFFRAASVLDHDEEQLKKDE